MPRRCSAQCPRSHAKGNYDQAIQDSNKAIELDHTLAQAYINRAYAYNRKGDIYKSIADCNEALEIEPNLTDGYYHRAFAYKALDKKEEAISDFQKFISLSNNETLIETARQEINKLSISK